MNKKDVVGTLNMVSTASLGGLTGHHEITGNTFISNQIIDSLIHPTPRTDDLADVVTHAVAFSYCMSAEYKEFFDAVVKDLQGIISSKQN